MPTWKLLATDYDRTLTHHPGGMPAEVPLALQRARDAGLLVAVVSGQPLARLRRALPDLDAYVAENGAVVAWGETEWRHPWPGRAALLQALTKARVPYTSLESILDLPRDEEHRLAPVLAAFPAVRAVPNVDRINLQPVDVDKGRGLAMVQDAYGIPKAATVAVGDGENDVALFRQAGLGVAVANATPAARAAAHMHVALEDGEGVVWLVGELLAGRLVSAAR